ncbi:MAG: efflux RND transporter permease subunit, partial [Gammaproteobacteria bacterium]
MTLTRLSLSNPVAVSVAIILTLIFAFISLSKLPIQLTPEVTKPEITIRTGWRSAAPEEIESEIIDPQESALRGLPGSTEILAKAQRGQAEITLTFQVGTDLRRALLEVMNRLNRVSRYPVDADEPVISTVGGNSRAIAWFIIKPGKGNSRDIASYQDYIEDVVQSRFERVPGVALSEVRGGRSQEVRITFDPEKAAFYRIGLPETVNRIANTKDTSGGFAEVGKRRYTIRYQGAYHVKDLRDMIVAWREGEPVYLRDIADIDLHMVDRSSFVIQNGESAMAVNAHRESGVNVLEVMQGLRQAAKELQQGPLKRANLKMEQVYDETLYIHRSMNMLRNNLLLGIALAVIVLWWFLRKFRATLIVALAIPICVISSFIFFYAAGRTVNVISLAGLAFSVGMVLDAAIIVLENIVRQREQGQKSHAAALQGTAEVWGALLASTATTVAIFLPIVFLQDESGQLFADLALTLSATIILSLIVAITVLPVMSSRWLQHIRLTDPHHHWWERGTGLVISLTQGRKKQLFWFVVLFVLPIVAAYLLKPKADYLPQGNRNLVFAFILPPPGMNIDTLEREMGKVIARRMQPYIEGTKSPRVKDYFFVAFNSGAFMGARTADPKQTGKLVGLINQA